MKPQTIGQVGITSILNFLEPQIPTKYFKAIKKLFAPCCELNIASVSTSCSPDPYTVDVTLSIPVVFYDTPTWVINIDGNDVPYTSVSYSNGVVTFTDVSVSSGTYPVIVTALVPTSSDGNTGYYQSSPAFAGVAFPSC